METSENKANSSLKDILNARPDKKTTFLFQAVILSLFVHIFIFGVIYLATSTTADPLAEETESEAVEELELSFEEPELDPQVQESNMSEAVANLLAQSGTSTTTERVNYTGKSQAEIDAEVLQSLKGLEAAEKEKLATNHKDHSIKDNPNSNPKAGKDDKNAAKENYDWYKNNSNKSYSGPVSAEYSIKDHTAKSSPKPTYRCKSAGKVIVNIEVNQLGEVVNAYVDERSTAIDCIREESLTYAKKWKFDYNDKAAKKQPGTITFTFSAQ
jgi:TonB family protein